MGSFKPTRMDRVLMSIAPGYGLSRMRARMVAETFARHYEGASSGRRTQGWNRRSSDANAAAGSALSTLRAHSRDLVRNNGWACNGIRVITRNVVGYGITPKVPKKIAEAWSAWAGTTACDAAGRLTFSGLQKLALRTIVESGEVLIRRRLRRPEDGLPIPMQLQVLEPDFLDTSKNGIPGQQGGVVSYGVEFDAIGRRVAYWLYDRHPGAAFGATPVSKRIPASEVIHAYDLERAGQDRGVPWFAPALVSLKDFDEFEDATLMKQKIAAFFAVFKTDIDGTGSPMGATSAADPGVEELQPGTMVNLAPGQDVRFPTPPSVTDDGFSLRTLRRIAAAIGVTYEDLTGDYSQVNFSSARMSRLAHWGNVYDWQWNMLVPLVCDPAWAWAMEAAALVGLVGIDEVPKTEWTPQPMPMTEPDREARANVLMVRSGQKSLSEVIREQGKDPVAHLAELAADMKRLDALGLHLDVDVRRVSQAGLTQARPSGTGFNDEAKDAEEMAGAKGGEGPPGARPGEDETPDETKDEGE